MAKASSPKKSVQIANGQLSLTFQSVTVSTPVGINPEVIELRTVDDKKILIREPLKLLAGTNSFTFFERRLYWLVLREIRNIQAIDPTKLKPFEELRFRFHYTDLVKGHANASIQKTVDALQKRKISWEDEAGKHTEVVVFPMAQYWPKKGVIELTMYHAVIPVFLYLGNGYAQYGYEEALMLSSEYAQILFTTLARYRRTRSWRVSLDDLRKMIGATDKSYSTYSAFRTRVIDLSLKQINEHTSLNVSYVPTVQGRAVVGLEFIVDSKNPPEKIEIDERRAMMRQRHEELMQLDIANLISYAADQLTRHYGSFSEAQKKTILTQTESLKNFINADLYAEFGFADKPEAYVATSVFKYKTK
jgi:plasmid replication initiation protein